MTSTDTDDDDMFSCIEPHPYGVLPSGNVYFGSHHHPSQALLPEEEWQQILQYCDGTSLAQIVQTCRDWYVAGHQPELWRDLLLRQYGSVVEEFQNCWKDTYVKRHVGKLAVAHQPMAVPGVFSQVYYRTHLCRSFQIPSSWNSVEGGTIERVSLSQLSENDFLTKYEETNTPVVLAGACKSWKAFQKWNSVDYLANSTSGQNFRATSGAAPLHAEFTLAAYHDYCKSPLLEEAPLYLFDRTALVNDNSRLKDDYYPDLQRTCPFWDPSQGTHDLFQYLGRSKRPDHTWLIMGPRRSGSSWHVDPNSTHAWNAAICGRKRWIFYPPGCTPPGVYPSADGEEVAMPISIGEWLLNYYQQEHVSNLHSTSLPDRRPLECTVEPGDVIFVPHGWWHAVVNIDEKVNIAITHNYVSLSNLPTVLRFLEHKQEHISGCRDRQESIKPAQLKRAFEESLVKHGFETVLQHAQKVAAKGWICNAWTDDTTTMDENEEHAQTQKNRKRQREATCADSDRPESKSTSGSIMTKAKQNSTAFRFSFL